jgi:hypothetical protein
LALQFFFLFFHLAPLFRLALFLFLDRATGCRAAKSAKRTTNQCALPRAPGSASNNRARTSAQRRAPKRAALARRE